jgi:hypothetical protein
MIYYQFAVAPAVTHPDFSRLGYGIASVMVKADDDIKSCTARALEHLAREHWEIVEIRNARMVEAENEIEQDGRLLQLYREATHSGIALRLLVPGMETEELATARLPA